ncbi:MAG: BatD family protein [Nitrosomonas sp.]|nr:BatD family protein [Nitrosomonas sp.]MDP1950933.1 BatD family protein [Nitrosomonas sp.]
MKMKKFLVLTLTAWLLCFVPLQVNAALTAHLDRNRVTAGETVRLTIEASGQVSSMPDTQALTDDFDVMGMISGSRLNMVNGKIDSRTTWTLSLSPKRSGVLTIPPLKIKGEQTPILTLQVDETSADSGADATIPVFIETEVDQTDPYVQSKVRFTLRVLFAVDLAQGSLTEPEPENALVQRLGEDREYTVTRDGKPYHVIEREFIIFPQTSGHLLIPGPVLDAQIPAEISRNDPFFNRLFTNSRPIRLRGEAITLNVRPRPEHSRSQYWLPAESVELLDDWQPADGKIAVGDPLTRHIKIKALGVTGEQLPDLQFTDIEGFKLYPDRAQSNTQNLQQNIQGEKTLRLAYMPTQPGKYTLPAFTLHWWDTRTDSERAATLAARTIEVMPAADQHQDTSTQPPGSAIPGESTVPQSAQKPEAGNFIPAEGAANGATTPALNHNGWFWASLVFATLWLTTLGLWWRKRHCAPPATEKNKTPNPEAENSRNAKKRFLAACHANDPQQARHHLLQWAAAHWPQSPPKGLEDLATRLNNPAISAALTSLDRRLYQGNAESWQGLNLARLLAKLPQQQRESADKPVLPGLY